MFFLNNIKFLIKRNIYNFIDKPGLDVETLSKNFENEAKSDSKIPQFLQDHLDVINVEYNMNKAQIAVLREMLIENLDSQSPEIREARGKIGERLKKQRELELKLGNIYQIGRDIITKKYLPEFKENSIINYIITEPEIEIKEGTEITYTFKKSNGAINKDLYAETTAGNSLPGNITQIESNGRIFYRPENSESGEFYLNPRGKIGRLLIHDGTKVKIRKTKENTVQNSVLKPVQKEEKREIQQELGTKNERIIENNITLNEILKLPAEERLSIITKGNTDFSDIRNGNVNEVELLIPRQLERNFNLANFVPKDWKGIWLGGRYYERYGNKFRTKLHYNRDKKIQEHENLTLNAIKGFNRKVGGNPKFPDNMKISFNEIEPKSPQMIESIDVNKLSEQTLKKLNLVGLTNEELKNSLHFSNYSANSREMRILLLAGTISTGLPIEWVNNKSLQTLLKRESTHSAKSPKDNIGVLNYSINASRRRKGLKNLTTEDFKKIAIEKPNQDNPTGSVSSASGLSQSLLINVDYNYPDGRKGIGDPFNEVVGLLRYIKNRYKTPERALTYHRIHKHY